jgi:hypothetical protein
MAKKRPIIPAHKTSKKVTLPKIGTPSFRGAPEGKKTVLHIGLRSATPAMLHSSFNHPSWHVVRLDTHADVQPDFVGSITHMHMLPDQSVEAIWCPQVLQKLFYYEIHHALKEAYRVLTHGGSFYMSVPDGQIAGAYLAHNRANEALYTAKAGDVTSVDLLYGFQPAIQKGNLSLVHHCVFTTDSLVTLMRESGFTNIQIKRDNFELQVSAMRYADDDPKRVERTTITQNNKVIEHHNIPAVPPIPTQQVASVGYRTRTNMMYDELDQPPKIWQPLHLK